MRSDNDIKLVKSAVNGDGSAFECLVNRHYMLVYRTAYKWCGIKEDAEDVTQEVFVKLARAIHNFKGDSAFTTWLYRIAINTAKDFHRKSSTKTSNEAAYWQDKAIEATVAEDNNPVSSAQLYATLDKLPLKLKEAVILVLAEGLSHKEAAVTLNCAETTVSWRIFQARRKLKKLLKYETDEV